MESRQCVACSQAFRPRPQAPQQSYCGPRPVNVSGGAAGSGPSARAIPTTARTRRGRTGRGVAAIPRTGASTGARIRSMRRATECGSTSVMADGEHGILQTWTRQRLDCLCPQELTGWRWRRRAILQRWTRGRYKSLCFQRRRLGRRRLAKRGRHRHPAARGLVSPAWTRSPPRASRWTCTAWNCALPARGCSSRTRWRASPARSSAAAK